LFVPPRSEIYRAISHQIRSIFVDYTALIEPLSLDEAYLDVTGNARRIPTAAEIRARIFEGTGLTASAGISYNKLLAKLASERRKPNGQFVVTPAMGAAFVEALPVDKFHGVGPVTAGKMNRLGIFTGADLRRQSFSLPAAALRQGWSVVSRHLQWPGRPSGRTRPTAQVLGIGNNLLQRLTGLPFIPNSYSETPASSAQPRAEWSRGHTTWYSTRDFASARGGRP
jgi:hypothetical protein